MRQVPVYLLIGNGRVSRHFQHYQEFNIPAATAHLFLQQQIQNIMNHYPSALTGPLVRDDENTIQKNLTALTHDAFQSVYRSFVVCYQQQKAEEIR